MKHSVFLHPFFDIKDCLAHLVVIPSSCSCAKPPPELYRDDVEKQRLIMMAQQQKVALTFPYDDNIFCGRWHYTDDGAEYTHAPNQRAAMLFEAICAKDKRMFKYNVIYLSDGMGSVSVIAELKNLISKYGALPYRMDTLKIYGFDDAVYLQSYLAGLGVCTPVYYSRGLNALLSDIHINPAGGCALKALNISAKAVQWLNGYIVPEHITPAGIKLKHDKTYFVVSELDKPADIRACFNWIKKGCGQIVFVLSQDTLPQRAINFAQQVPPSIPVFLGTPVGHGACLNTGRPVTLFAPAFLSVPSQVPVLSWTDTADLKIAA